MEANYWRIPYSSLPSRGKYYPSESKIEFRCLNIHDMKYMAGMNADNAESMVNDLLRRCLKLTNIQFKDLKKMDRLTFVFFIRSSTFVLTNQYKTEFKCPFCGIKNQKSISPGDLEVRYIEDSNLRTSVFENFSIGGEYKNIEERSSRTGDDEIDMILDNTDIVSRLNFVSDQEAKDWLLGLPADDYAGLKTIASKARCGVLGHAMLTCSGCRKTMKIGVDIRDHALFNRVNTAQLIKNQINVSKYCGIVMQDDMPYNEVELMISIVNNMLKEEKETREKRRSKR